MKRFLPLYRHLRAVKWQFAAGVVCGLVFALASGAGLPLITQVVFPYLFGKKDIHQMALQIQPLQFDGFFSFLEQPLGALVAVLNPRLAGIEAWLGGLGQDQFLLTVCLWLPAIFLVRAVAGYSNASLIHYSGSRVLEDLRTDIFIKLQSLPLDFFKKNRSGDLLARLMNDTQIMQQVLVNTASDLVKQPATLLSALGFLAWNAWTDRSFFIALISLFSVPICVFVIRYAGKRMADRARSLQKIGGNLTAELTESLQSALEIRAYNLEERQISIFKQRVRAMLRMTVKIARYRQAISPSVEFVAALGFAVALFFGVRAGMSQEGFMALGMALFMSYEPIKKLGVIHTHFRQGEASLDRMERILNQPDNLPDPPNLLPLTRPARAIRFENVSFAYEKELVLRDVNLEIPIGQVVALVGPSGAGKSTFANLIPRFYDPTEGYITIDGVDLREVTKKALRQQIAVVPQMPTLFAGTVADNIRLGRLDATDEEIRDAAVRAHAHDFIAKLPKGYDTEVGERGGQLSGGQRQRVAIARAFLRDAPILILDEATSALDAESESMVQAALADLIKGRTTFIIAHRFSTISIAERILVFDQGRISADGNHQQLRDTNPIYQAMAAGHVL